MAQRERGGRGWYDFAGAMLGLAGFFNGIEGLRALFAKEYFAGAPLLYDDVRVWAWVWLLVGIAQIGVAVALFDGRGRLPGIALAGLSAVVAFASLDAAPVWSVVIIAIDVLVIHGLAVHPDPPGDVRPSSDRPRVDRDVPMGPR